MPQTPRKCCEFEHSTAVPRADWPEGSLVTAVPVPPPLCFSLEEAEVVALQTLAQVGHAGELLVVIVELVLVLLALDPLCSDSPVVRYPPQPTTREGTPFPCVSSSVFPAPCVSVRAMALSVSRVCPSVRAGVWSVSHVPVSLLAPPACPRGRVLAVFLPRVPVPRRGPAPAAVVHRGAALGRGPGRPGETAAGDEGGSARRYLGRR